MLSRRLILSCQVAELSDPKYSLQTRGAEVLVQSEHGARLILFGVARFPSPRHIAASFVASFVASSPDKSRQWIHDYQTGNFPRIGVRR